MYEALNVQTAPDGRLAGCQTPTVKLLQELRDGQRSQTEELHELRNEMREGRDRADQRFEIIETSLRDLAEQMVMMTRAVKVALEA
ncbi:MAG: hypothetical protein Q8N26_25985 [Myxococcales bacterium]|nr:hypothetical protein [Myxococcales bacterium]